MDLVLNNLPWLICHKTQPNLIQFSVSSTKKVKRRPPVFKIYFNDYFQPLDDYPTVKSDYLEP